jgi:hypothetical protein
MQNTTWMIALLAKGLVSHEHRVIGEHLRELMGNWSWAHEVTRRAKRSHMEMLTATKHNAFSLFDLFVGDGKVHHMTCGVINPHGLINPRTLVTRQIHPEQVMHSCN